MELQNHDARASISGQFIMYQSQFRAVDLACRTHGTPIPALVLERHIQHTSTIHARKLELVENALTMAKNKFDRLELQSSKEDLTGISQCTAYMTTLICARRYICTSTIDNC